MKNIKQEYDEKRNMCAINQDKIYNLNKSEV